MTVFSPRLNCTPRELDHDYYSRRGQTFIDRDPAKLHAVPLYKPPYVEGDAGIMLAGHSNRGAVLPFLH
jgi:hypothetical protein